MHKQLTLGSLFDGSGGFPLGAVLSGIKPIWASEVLPFPIAVTRKRFPDMLHLGDINKLDGAVIPPVDIITFGSPCQSFSIAGKREGLAGKSGLFYEAVRVIREMRHATNGEYPRFAVMENVPGIFSSVTNENSDFQEVLNELIRIKDESAKAHPRLSIPLPKNGKWAYTGEIVGDGYSLAWRTLDAQYWGVAQRRRRCYIVLDLTGERAGEILFDESRLRGNPPQSGFPWQAAAGGSAIGIGSAVAFEPGACSRLGCHVWNSAPVGALRADMGDNQTAVVIENHPADSRVKINENGIVQTLPGRMGTGGGSVPLVASFMGGQGADAGSIAYSETASPTIRGQAGGNSVPMVMAAYGISSYYSNAMLSPNPHSGIYEATTSRTLDTSVPDPNKNAGGMAIVALEGNGARPSHKGSGIGADVSFTLNATEQHGVCYAMTAGGFTQVYEEQSPTLMSRDYKDPPLVNLPQYIVRRLTTKECALLQGFPPDWCDGLETPEPTEEDIVFWASVWETHRNIAGTSSKPKTRKQIIKWLQNPHSDAAEYSMWGNAVALPCVVFVLGGIVYNSQH